MLYRESLFVSMAGVIKTAQIDALIVLFSRNLVFSSLTVTAPCSKSWAWWPDGRVVMQRFAKPWTSVQFRFGPPLFSYILYLVAVHLGAPIMNERLTNRLPFIAM